MPSLASALALLLRKANITSANDFADWLLRAPTTIANTIKTSAFQAEAEAIEALEAAEAANVAAEVEELRMQLDAARTTTAAVQDEASTARSLAAASVEAARAEAKAARAEAERARCEADVAKAGTKSFVLVSTADEVVKMLVANVMNVNIEIPRVVKGDFEANME